MKTVTTNKQNPGHVLETDGFPVGGGLVFCFLKRAFDIICSLLGLVLLLLPMLVIAVIVRIDSPGPAIFKQERMGQNCEIFTILKFRTLRIEAPDNVATLEISNMDTYLTSVGGFLRRTSLDELPQLFNILVGQMSFVGYRPVCLSEHDLNSLRKKYGVFAAKPGLTGLAQIRGRDNISFVLKAKIDAEYVRNRSLRLDLWCLLKTVKIVFSGEGVI